MEDERWNLNSLSFSFGRRKKEALQKKNIKCENVTVLLPAKISLLFLIDKINDENEKNMYEVDLFAQKRVNAEIQMFFYLVENAARKNETDNNKLF